MNARKQVLVVLTALMVVCSGGAMVTAASGSGAVDSGDTASDGEYDSANETDGDESTTDETVADEDETAVGDDDGEMADNETGLEEDAAGQQSAYVTFEDQETDGQTVVVENVTLASGGFVTIHDSSLLVGDVFESVIGTSAYLEAGTHEQVEVTLDEPLEEDETLIAMPHRDTNDNEGYDFVESEGAADGPYLTADDEPVTDDAVVSVGAADEEPVAEEPAEEDNETVVDEEPVEEDNETIVDEEPADEDEDVVDDEPAMDDGLTINVVIEQLTVIVGENGDDLGMDGETDAGDEDEQADDGATVDGNETATDDGAVDSDDGMADDETETGDETTADAAGLLGNGDLSFEQVTVTVDVENIEIQSASDDPSHDDGTGDDLDTETNDTETDTDDAADGVDNGDDGAVEDDGDQQGDQIQVTIEEATVYVNLGDMDEQPVEEEPVEDEEPVEEEPTEDNETDDDLEPIEDEPTEDNETDDNETDDGLEPIEDEPTEDNETEDNETDDGLEPIEDEPTDNETEEEPIDNETEPAESFEVSNLDAPASAEVGETITVTATIENPSDEERTETAQFRLDGDLVDEQNVTLEGDESDDVEFEVDTSDLAAGDYIHMILTDEAGEVATLELTEATDDTELEDGDDGLENDTADNETADNGTDDGLENDTDEETALVGA
ncbi:hypothetical protein C478_14632 [Natrinema thermotolerans DSM 11552]|nr:hypothetical protein C478_14632 [Natrinema thermotolerans DSM 11552]